MRVILLGTGTSHGVPVIGCNCSVCTSPDQRNRRTRSSCAVQLNGATILLDTATELRLQALASGIHRVDTILYTHFHADHVSGIDDVKAFNTVLRGPVPCYGNASTYESLQQRYDFALAGTPWIGASPHLAYTVMDEPFELFGAPVTPVVLQHGRIESHGWRIGDMAYLTDTNGIPPASMELLRGLDLMIVDGLRFKPHPTHFTISQAIAVIQELKPRKALLTHLTHDVEFSSTTASLPPDIGLAYDGLVIDLP
ncbi:MAG: MBL fold metallo-hydrolase [Chloroflexi bacterium]|nr:MBL fold metallo-hydrolase [Chloroflexota bacterium]